MHLKAVVHQRASQPCMACTMQDGCTIRRSSHTNHGPNRGATDHHVDHKRFLSPLCQSLTTKAMHNAGSRCTSPCTEEACGGHLQARGRCQQPPHGSPAFSIAAIVVPDDGGDAMQNISTRSVTTSPANHEPMRQPTATTHTVDDFYYQCGRPDPKASPGT